MGFQSVISKETVLEANVSNVRADEDSQLGRGLGDSSWQQGVISGRETETSSFRTREDSTSG